MIPTSKIIKQSVSSSLLIDRKKREREKNRNKLGTKKYPPQAKERFGKEFQIRLCELFLSDDPTAVDQLRAMHDEALAFYNEHDLTELWLSDEETEGKELKAPVSKKMHQDPKIDARPIGSVRPPNRPSEEKEKIKLKVTVPPPVPPVPAAPIAIAAASAMSQFELSDDSEEEPVKETPPTYHNKPKLCDVCDGQTVGTNTLLDCDECGKSFHLKCNRPEISTAQARDPRFLFVCFNCKDRESKVDRTAGGNNSGQSKVPSTSGANKDDKTTAQKSSASDFNAAWASFTAKKNLVKNKTSSATTPGYGSLAMSTTSAAAPSSSSSSSRSTFTSNTSKNFPSLNKK